MGTEKFIFEGPFYYLSQTEHDKYMKKVNVVLNKITVRGDEQERFCLSIKGKKTKSRNFVFSASELCYAERDEEEVKERQTCSVLDCYGANLGIRRTLFSLYIVIKQHDRPNSVNLKFLQDGSFSRQSDNGLDKLYREILNIMGQMFYWFGQSGDRTSNSNPCRGNERLVATPRNVCTLNSDMKILQFYSIENKTVIVNYDHNSNITIKIQEDFGSSASVQNFVQGHEIKFRPGGREIQQKLSKLWCLTVPCTTSEMPPMDVDITNDIITGPTNREHESSLSRRGGEILFNRSTGQQVGTQRNVSSSNGHVPNMDTGMTLNFSLDLEQTHPKSTGDSCLPPPSPCVPPSITFVEVSFDPAPSSSSLRNCIPLPKGILRSQSYVNLKYQCLQDLKKDRPTENIYGDNYDYYKIYYRNTGWIKYHKSSMRRKIQRRSRLSNEIKNVDFQTVDKHEVWYDQTYKDRNADENYRRVNKVYESLSAQQLPQNIPKDDDPYWNSDLCLTIQYVLENKKPKLTEIFDLSFAQMVGVCVHLTVEKTLPSKDWRDLAEYIGLNGQDIEIIQHFCYKYHEWTTEVVLIHWVFQMRRGNAVRECSYDALKDYVMKLERNDVLAIIQCNVSNNFDDEEDFWEENTRL